MARTYSLIEVDPKKVAFSDSNPRGETAEEMAEDEGFERLKGSVYQHGVLVPIVVHKQTGGDSKPYRLVDGERRLRAALATGLGRVPAHVAPAAEDVSDLIQAVHIHMLRKQWKPVAQARALKRIMRDLRARDSEQPEREAIERLQEATGLTDRRLSVTLQRYVVTSYQMGT
jgi:ParB/RepB/Spo0J family partition protein